VMSLVEWAVIATKKAKNIRLTRRFAATVPGTVTIKLEAIGSIQS
jgi:hypothetical protein